MTVQTSPPVEGAAAGPAWHTLSIDDALTQQGVTADAGLSAAEAASRAQRFGPNKFAEGKREPRWRTFLRQYADPMQIVLLVAGIVCYPIGQPDTGRLLILLTVLNAVMGVNQEGKAAKAVAALQQMMLVKAKVVRDGQVQEIPADQIVPGDVVNVEAGDVVPADGRIIRAATLEIDESALTGESVPVSKGMDPVEKADTPLGDRLDMAYMNTNVTRGAGSILVTATGMSTEVGHISGLLSAEKSEATPLTRQLNKLTNQILVVAGLALLASMALGLWRGEEWDVLFITAVAFAVSAIPTGLPAVVTTILSMGTQTLAKAGAIMKRLRSVETLGSTSAINSDKTGTLTLNQMTAVEMSVPGRRYAITGSGYSTDGQINKVGGQADVKLDPFLLPMALCADAVVKDGQLIGDPTEGALVVLAAKGGIDPTLTRQEYPRVAELPFDAAYKLMATFHAMKDESGADVVRAFVKGAPDQLLARAGSVLAPDLAGVQPVDDAVRKQYEDENQRLGEKGLRVMATARKDFDPATFDAGADLLPLVDGMTLLALVGIVDPPRPAAKASIATAKSAGIQVRMITGDHAVTAQAIATDLGIEGRAITGAEFGAMSDEEAVREIDGIGVIARVTPEHKVRLVDVLKKKGHIVAMTGDGVNDAPALKKADIGIAMGITGTEVSKEAAVMILTDDDFATIVKAVELGRGLYDNLKKYIRAQMGWLFGFIFTFLGASIFNIAGGIPFVPYQTLWINFTVDVFQAVGLGYGKPAEGLMNRKPRPENAPILATRLLVWLAVAGFTMGATTLAIIWWATTAFPSENDAIARTMGFTTFAISNLAFSWATKDERRSVFSAEVMQDRGFVIASLASALSIFLAVNLDFLQNFLTTTQLTADQWLICIVGGLLVVVVSEIRKLVWKAPLDEEPETVAGTPDAPAPQAAPAA
ncbi:MAG: cation-transporting P-type ATPase [Chloroflexi bacterium]|jgi:Ca2+-transporting ATPase|nr:cation-transporting P-type ATPase [Chloroflexota bacterium]